MPYKSPIPPVDIRQCNVLSFLFPEGEPVSDRPQWIDAANPTNSLSGAQALTLIKRFAVGLDNLGVAQGRAVMIVTPNHLYVPVIYLAAAGSSRCFTGANPAFTEAEIAYQMKMVDAAVVLVHPSALPTATAAAKKAGLPLERLYLFAGQPCKPINGVPDWTTLLATEESSRDWRWDPLTGDKSLTAVAVINFSSGTTGLSKGVCITHSNLVANATQATALRFAPGTSPETIQKQERWINFLPLYHAYSQLWMVSIALKQRIPVYIMEKFQFVPYLAYIQRYRITSLLTVPPVILMLAKRPETAKYDLSSVTYVACGAAPLSKELQNDVGRRFNLSIVQAWGMSETTCIGAMVPSWVSDETGSVGHLLPNTEAKLIDEDGEEVTERGKPGELLLRGPQIMLGYWKNEAATRDSKTTDGWLHTGDVAVEKNDMFTIVDRRKELIKVNGLQVAPAELEAALLELDDVADAAVVGIVLHGDEMPRAYVVLQPSARGKTTEKSIQDRIAARVAKHKRLAGGVKFIDEVPKLASGKIVRKLVKQWARDEEKEVEKTIKARL